MYQQINLPDHTLVGMPGLLPSNIAGLPDSAVADISAVCSPPPPGMAGQGWWPVTLTTASYDPTAQTPDGTYSYAANVSAQTVTGTANLRAATAAETAAAQATLRQAQSALLNAACVAQIVSGYPSSALGVVHTYPSKPTDQANMTASVTDSQRVPPAWQATTAYRYWQDVMVGSTRLIATVAGTSASAAPAGPGPDGTVTWAAWSTPFWTEDAAGTWAYQPHTEAQIQAAGADGKIAVLSAQAKLATLNAQLAAATTQAQITAVTW